MQFWNHRETCNLTNESPKIFYMETMVSLTETIQTSVFQSLALLLTEYGPWPSYINLLFLSFFIYKMELITELNEILNIVCYR